MNNYPIYFLNTHGVFLLLIAILFYARYKNSRELAIHVVLSCVIAGSVALFLKELFDIPRPYIVEDLPALAGYSVRTSSLPSLHTTLAFAAATTLALHQRKLGIITLVIAGLIGFGRVAANVHYPFDISIGSVLGAGIALLIEHIHLDSVRPKK